ncbi:MAG: hypothetical protein H6843_09935 [Rhodospirillaceae bacterium]|nr:hypothetical protein [Rhodospirillaceae bacterium]
MSAVTLAPPGMGLSTGLGRPGRREEMPRWRRLAGSLALHAALLAVLLVDLSFLRDPERIVSIPSGTRTPATLLVDVSGLTAPEAIVPEPITRETIAPDTLDVPPPRPRDLPGIAANPSGATPVPVPPVPVPPVPVPRDPPAGAAEVPAVAAPVPAHRPTPPPAPRPMDTRTAEDPAQPVVPVPPVDATTQATGEAAPAAAATPGPPTRLSPGEEDAVREALRPCWNVDSGGSADADRVVHIALRMARDGTVIPGSVEVIPPTHADDPVWVGARNAAWRAVNNPTCQPLPLPPERWPDWEYIAFTFDPRDMF